MNYSNMIKTEDTDSMYQAWEGYRKELTSYICKALKTYCKRKSWIAIWGAGGCNDIDIRELSVDYKLLLIDRDVEKLIQVRNRLGLNDKECKVADLEFWNIADEDYEMFQALLMDGADTDEIQSYFDDLIHNMITPINLEEYSVEGSVVVGLASQLNARFAAMVHLQRERISDTRMEELMDMLDNMNQLATEKLFISVRQITNKILITGYETCGCSSEEDAIEECNRLKECFEKGLDDGYYLSGNEANYIKVAGNEYWHRLLYNAVLMDKVEEAGLIQVINWPFLSNKNYPMLLLSLILRK